MEEYYDEEKIIEENYFGVGVALDVYPRAVGLCHKVLDVGMVDKG